MSEYFSLDRISVLSKFSANAHIHIIGVCGVAMAPLAVELARKGFRVSGSDKEYYEPMASLLRTHKLELKQGYQAGNIDSSVELVVIGNAVSRNNPEVVEVQRREIAYTCAPALLYDLVINTKRSVVVSGTHGKSTTSALLANALKNLNASPSFFIGALPLFAQFGLESKSGSVSVVEGDEYDSAFFAKQPKFLFYKPDILIVSSVEYDHADIYPDLESINQQFTKLVSSMPKGSVVICQADLENLGQLSAIWQSTCNAKIVRYGINGNLDFKLLSSIQNGVHQTVRFSCKALGERSFELPMLGQHNALNSLAAYAALLELGFEAAAIEVALAGYRGIKRRQEVVFESNELIIIDDFAHHPTAVRETLNAVRKAFPTRKIWGIFEPRSNSSRRKVFQRDYVSAFNAADQVVLANIEKREIDQGQQLLNVSELSQDIEHSGVKSICLPDAESIASYLLTNRATNDLFLIMSNGSFAGLVSKLLAKVQALS